MQLTLNIAPNLLSLIQERVQKYRKQPPPVFPPTTYLRTLSREQAKKVLDEFYDENDKWLAEQQPATRSGVLNTLLKQFVDEMRTLPEYVAPTMMNGAVLITANIPEDILVYVDAIVTKGSKTPPVWPFPGEVRSDRMTQKDEMLLKKFKEEKAEYDAAVRGCHSRSAVINRMLQVVLNVVPEKIEPPKKKSLKELMMHKPVQKKA